MNSQYYIQHLNINKQLMRKSWSEDNRKMVEAYEAFIMGNVQQSLNIYQSVLQNTGNPSLKINLACTISVLETSLGHYNYAVQNLQNSLNELCVDESILKVRSSANLCLLYIVMGKLEEGVELSKQLFNFIRWRENRKELLDFVCRLFFRVNSIEELKSNPELGEKISLLEAFFLMNIAFCKDICQVSGSIQILKAIYPTFLQNQRFQLAISTLRHLLMFQLPQSQTLHYEKQLSKLVLIGIEDFEYNNVDAIDCCRLIASSFIKLKDEIKEDGEQEDKRVNWKMWKVLLAREMNKIKGKNQIGEEEKEGIYKNFQLMRKEENELIVKQMAKTNFYKNAERQISNILLQANKVLKNNYNKSIQYAFSKLIFRAFSCEQPKTSRLSISQKRITNSNKTKENVGISMVKDSKQNINTERSILKENQKDKSFVKMIKFCEYGSFLSKRNFNSDGGQYRFVRINNSFIKWAKNPQQMEKGAQLYPLKDVKSIHYGKITSTLNKQCNNLLRQYFCFSLHLQKRTLDFYCNDFQQTCNWVCGTSAKLKSINPKIVGYNRAKMRWRKLFMILRENFTNKLKTHERTYYYQNAYAVILFRKNGYKLPQKP